MKKLTKIKIALDIAMMIVLALMYSKSALGLTFHEIGGLAVIGAFVIHKLLNIKWIVGVSRKLFAKNTPARTRAAYLVDALLLVSFLIIGVSGALISKKVFHFELNGMIYKTLHYTTSAIALMLIGVHMGLHAAFLGGVFKKIVRKPCRFIKPIGIALLVVTVAFGAYNIAATSFSNWLSMPFRSADMPRGERAPDMEGIAAIEGDAEQADAEVMQGMRERKGRGEENINPFNAVVVFVRYFSIAMVFATATWGVEKLVRPKKRIQPTHTSKIP